MDSQTQEIPQCSAANERLGLGLIHPAQELCTELFQCLLGPLPAKASQWSAYNSSKGRKRDQLGDREDLAV